VTLELVNAAIGYGRKALISCLDLKVNSGDVIFLSGPNGSGKSTLAKNAARCFATGFRAARH
jgi:ABC-type cobalamin/Fe3+-siderophores transport system ATPase subunit